MTYIIFNNSLWLVCVPISHSKSMKLIHPICLFSRSLSLIHAFFSYSIYRFFHQHLALLICLCFPIFKKVTFHWSCLPAKSFTSIILGKSEGLESSTTTHTILVLTKLSKTKSSGFVSTFSECPSSASFSSVPSSAPNCFPEVTWPFCLYKILL